jgi:hypothetical protein
VKIRPRPPRACRQVVCIGDSITQGTAGRPPLGRGVTRNWVEQLASALDTTEGPRPGDGFRGLWRGDEWGFTGAWTRTERTSAFDVAPFGQGWFSSGQGADRLTWTRPVDVDVAAFDIYWFHMPDTGNWQYRIDGDRWTNVGLPVGPPDDRLHRRVVRAPVRQSIDIRGHDGRDACIAGIAGINVYAAQPARPPGTIVHNLGHNFESLLWFCRSSAGNPLALLDDLRPDAVTVLFSNDVPLNVPQRFRDALCALVERIRPYADVLIISPYEQRPPRRVHDALTRAGETVVTSPTASFVSTDVRWPVSGANIVAGTTIASVLSAETASLSDPATGSCTHGDLVIGGREASSQAEHRAIAQEVAETMDCAYLDLFSAWASIAGPGWDSANSFGLMHDRLHPSQLGHDNIATRVQVALETLPGRGNTTYQSLSSTARPGLPSIDDFPTARGRRGIAATPTVR